MITQSPSLGVVQKVIVHSSVDTQPHWRGPSPWCSKINPLHYLTLIQKILKLIEMIMCTHTHFTVFRLILITASQQRQCTLMIMQCLQPELHQLDASIHPVQVCINMQMTIYKPLCCAATVFSQLIEKFIPEVISVTTPHMYTLIVCY